MWLYCGAVGGVESMPGWPGPIMGGLWFIPESSIPAPPPPPPIGIGSWLLLILVRVRSAGKGQGRRETEEGGKGDERGTRWKG